MRDLLVIVLLLDSLAMIGLILLQHGKGADAGASFGGGGGGSESLFGAKGSSNFLSRTTAILAVIFFAVTLALAYAPLDRPSAKSVTEAVPAEQQAEKPVKNDKAAKTPKQEPGKPDQPVVPQ